MIEIENIEKLELSYWLKRYLKSNRMTEDSFAAYSWMLTLYVELFHKKLYLSQQ